MSTTLTQTTLLSAVDETSNTIRVASISNILVANGGGIETYMMINNEFFWVSKQPAVGTLQVDVVRGMQGTRANKHLSGSVVLIGRPNQFFFVDPSGAVDPNDIDVLPRVNVPSSNQWIANANKWVPGMGNPGNSGSPFESGVSAAVASAAGLITPSGPYFHVTGALAVTGFNVPEGWNGNAIAIIPDGAFTWTTATNIAVAGTAVVGKLLIFSYDPGTSKWYPSYIA